MTARHLHGAVALVLALVCGPAGVASAAPATVVLGSRCAATLSEGQVRGASLGRTCAFPALRFAAAPTGDLRFRPPAPPPTWTGVRRLTASATSVCPRVAANVTEEYRGAPPSSEDEDCLRLNVWAPTRAGRNRPVMVYVHGGAFLAGSGSQTDFDGAALADRSGAVVVTVNYRLGLLGYLELGARAPALAGSGNNGLRDQIAALRWVRRNARAFGGDPRRVTAFGQSAGAISISALLAGDRPRRLFRRAIVQSGSGYLVHSRAQAQELADEVFRIGGLRDPRQLQDMPVARLLALQDELLRRHPVSRGTLVAPYVDGDLVPGPVIARIAAGSARDVDLVIGTAADEATFFLLAQSALLALPAAANPYFPSALRDRQAQMIATYGARRPAGGTRPGRQGAFVAMLSDQLFRVPAIRQAQAQAAHNPRTYMYRFDYRSPVPQDAPAAEDPGALHCIELPFVFGGLRLTWVPGQARPTAATQADRRLLSRRVMDAWAAFARTGDPGGVRSAAAPRWPAYDAGTRATMLLDVTSRVVERPADDERAAWDPFPFDHVDFEPPAG